MPHRRLQQGQTVVLGNNQIRFIRLVAHLRARCRACGFTLIELMVTLAVAAILAAIAVPSFKHILVETNLSNVNNDLVGDLQYARTEAVSRQVNVAVAASGGSWQNGWRVQIPPASTAATATATVLRRHPAVASQYVLDPAPAGATSVTYQPQGTVAPAPAATTAGACFTISDPSGSHNQPRYLQVWSSGMIRQITDNNPTDGPTCSAPAP